MRFFMESPPRHEIGGIDKLFRAKSKQASRQQVQTYSGQGLPTGSACPAIYNHRRTLRRLATQLLDDAYFVDLHASCLNNFLRNCSDEKHRENIHRENRRNECSFVNHPTLLSIEESLNQKVRIAKRFLNVR
ncbi:hypothetical protein [Rhizobium mesosinicum]|uniref:Uncharacterized protein n=1 Tax=Rhizobium mesosinicum TaxID=335017 RepID=A0ABS7GTK2_9HYPH|nr:hypothetical protein [Rhizobium mesosinicum]MBW9053255.1 hypothetical protein [Rhizobium mesosinicum]